ncbi:MAG TPA: hypothetical protein VHW71_04375 [Steroidobacteraceae bacterium]|jgi:hypothetical protein|nr:hypothetical protein [Steroidobacteraceae bacterium]
MDAHLASVLWFALGVAVQAVLVIRADRNWGLLLFCLFFAAAGMIPDRSEVSYEPLEHALVSIGIFGFVLAVTFEKAILPVINEKIVLSYAMVFWYAIFLNIVKLGLPDWLIFASLAPTFATLVIAFTQPPLNLYWKSAMYAWFLVLILSLGLMQFSFGRLIIFTSPEDAPWLSPLECVTTGMAFLYLCVNATFVFRLIPIKGRDQTWEDEMKEWHELTNLMAYRFMDGPSPALGVAAIAAIEGGVLTANYLYHFISDGLLINLLIVLPGLIYFPNRVAPPRQAPDKEAGA